MDISLNASFVDMINVIAFVAALVFTSSVTALLIMWVNKRYPQN